jgi:hypothetical protein
VSFKSSIFSSLGLCTFRTNILHQRPFIAMHETLSLTNSALLTAVTLLIRYLLKEGINYSGNIQKSNTHYVQCDSNISGKIYIKI